jgi:glycine/D-amino acid oxidase-like deaminating enzyme
MGHLVVLDDSPAQLALTRLSLELWDALAPELPGAVEWDPCGTLWLAADGDELALAERKRAVYAAAGLAAEILDAPALRAAEPNLAPDLAGALRVPGDRVLYAPAAAAWLCARAVARGARLQLGCRVARAAPGGALLADGTRIDAAHVVVAAAAAAPALCDPPAPEPRIRPRKGHLVITDRYPGFCRHQLVELGYLRSAHGSTSSSVAFNLQPRRTGQLLLGSSRQFDITDDTVEGEVLAAVVARARRFVPRIGELAAIRAWCGFRAATDDHLPVIGAVDGRPGLWLATGHEGLGITTSLATARLLTDVMLGRTPPIDPAPFRVGREREGDRHG